MTKSAEAFRTISEVAEWLDTETHVLRFWESKFSQIRPIKRAGGRRYYRPKDMLVIGGIKKLLHDNGLTIKGTQKLIKDKGLKYLSDLSRPLDPVETDMTEAHKNVAEKILENSSFQPMEENFIKKFDEVDGQFSMFSDELVSRHSEPLKPDATYKSISNFLNKKKSTYSDKVLLEEILTTMEYAIKKRA